jgi:hypothetical protein
LVRRALLAMCLLGCGDDSAASDGPPDASADAAIPIDAALFDAGPPMFAGLASATADTAYSLRLVWTEANDAPNDPSTIQYRAYIGTVRGGENFATPASVTWGTSVGPTNGIVGALAPGTDYYVVVRASDRFGNEETNTVERMVHTPAAPRTISLASDLVPIFTANCAVTNCHAPPASAELLDLSTASSAYAGLVGVPSTHRPGLFRVKAFDSGQSEIARKLLAVVPPFGEGDPMPPPSTGMPLLSDADVSLVREWIDQGAPNN